MYVYLVIIFLSMTTACSTIEIDQEQLQEKPLLEQILFKGDIVKIYTKDNWEYEFITDNVSQDHIMGQNMSVPIASIARREANEKLVKTMITQIIVQGVIIMMVGPGMSGGPFVPVP